MEKIQEFDFEIDYRPGEEMLVADSLSRIYTNEVSEEKKMIESRRNKQVEGKYSKHVKEVNGKKIWVFDSGKEAEIPDEWIREKLIHECHVKLSHRCKTTVYYELRKNYYCRELRPRLRSN